MRFSRAEWASSLDLAIAARLTPSAGRAAQYLRHAADERRHSYAFSMRAVELGIDGRRYPDVALQTRSDELYERLGEAKFLALVHFGEARSVAELEARAAVLRALGDERSATLCSAIVRDEQAHASYTWYLLCEAVGERHARRLILRARAYELWRRAQSQASVVTSALYVALTTAIYFIAAPLIRPLLKDER